MAGDRVFDLIERLGALLRSELRRLGAPHGLEPVLLQALAYLARANRYSDTPIAVAEFLGLTKGNVSQRLIALEKAGMLLRRPDRHDARVVHLAPTAKAQALLAALSPPPAWRAAMAASGEDTAGLEAGLTGLLSALQRANGRRTFGQCRGCRFLQRDGDTFTCGLTRDPLEPGDTLLLCREHEAAA
ncbi:MarR family winged helix-turn-helix transcriptional regulator [Vineibacter terrae]|uniref:MarR family winged helix-turn-helix transcriptional regulator n=1 Tax=Vineibacter terrae TaxID=2586908 RepID=UPI002E32A350|nr:MarR family transcriptional regulator [Vineibacter terrae]HEX2887613.1 MarR family transcriptional regulator [Vineibacter terrae]